MDLLTRFHLISGLQINKKKTEAMWLGSNRSGQKEQLDIKGVDEPLKILGIIFAHDPKIRKEMNLDNTIKNIKQVLNLWKWRNLTLYGKIQILKTFVIPKFIYRAALLCQDKEIIKEMNTLMHNFLWNGKDKVKRKVIINQYEKGGLKMPHIESLIHAQRIMFLKRYISSERSYWKQFLHEHLNSIGSSFLLQCNFSNETIPSGLPLFYRECLIAWNKLKLFNEPSNYLEVSSEIIWNNRNILIDGNSVYKGKLHLMGIIYIGDIIDYNGKLFPFDTLLRNFPNLTFAEYFFLFSVFKSIPVRWKIFLENPPKTKKSSDPEHAQITFISNSKSISLEKASSKLVYNALLDKIGEIPTAQDRFQKIYPDTHFDWNKIYSLPFSLTIDVKHREFQWKILHRILYGNYMLKKIKKVDSSLCTFCATADETLEHLFFRCNFIKTFWNVIENTLTSLNLIERPFTELEVLIGYFPEGENRIIINFIILMGKRYIYFCRSKGIRPAQRISLFWNRVKYIYKVEYSIASEKNKLPLHFKKWNAIIPLIQTNI